MNPDTGRLIEQAGTTLPAGYIRLPEELQGAAKSLLDWAKPRQTGPKESTKQDRARKKRERQNRKAGRRHG